MLYKTIDELKDYCGEYADDFDLQEAAHYILFELNETVESINGDLLNDVLCKFEK